jgi:hypothetical protein
MCLLSLVGFLRITYFSTLKLEVMCSSETSVAFYTYTRRCVIEDSTSHYLLSDCVQNWH